MNVMKGKIIAAATEVQGENGEILIAADKPVNEVDLIRWRWKYSTSKPGLQWVSNKFLYRGDEFWLTIQLASPVETQKRIKAPVLVCWLNWDTGSGHEHQFMPNLHKIQTMAGLMEFYWMLGGDQDISYVSEKEAIDRYVRCYAEWNRYYPSDYPLNKSHGK